MTIHLTGGECILVGMAAAIVGLFAIYGLLSLFTGSK